MLPSTLADVKLPELQQLVDDAVRESKVIEYKKGFYVLKNPDLDERKNQHEELLKDVSCFANTIGGDLIIGIESKEGVAVDVCGFDHPNPDGLMLQITEILQQHLEPRISVAMRPIQLEAGRIVLVVRVRQSTIGPHRVVYQKQPGQFWARSDANAYRMDTSELRQAFTGSKSVNERIIKFQSERLAAIENRKTRVKLIDGPKVICHMIPLESFTAGVDHVMSALEGQLCNLPLLHPSSGWSPRYSEDGFVTCDGDTRRPSNGYSQLFRNGVIEAVTASDVTYMRPYGSKQVSFLTTYYQQELLLRLPKYCEALRNLGTQPPVSLFLTFTRMQGVRIHMDHSAGTPFSRDVLRLPPVTISDLQISDFDTLLRATFDLLWNTAGYARCFDYNDDGSYKYR